MPLPSKENSMPPDPPLHHVPPPLPTLSWSEILDMMVPALAASIRWICVWFFTLILSVLHVRTRLM